ncbi:hypothetical protein HBB16_00525 [Pseudonocardia sp. MCCB 268]|nr:hypothetical protein [Pseudonocardia cytotoxica]
MASVRWPRRSTHCRVLPPVAADRGCRRRGELGRLRRLTRSWGSPVPRPVPRPWSSVSRRLAAPRHGHPADGHHAGRCHAAAVRSAAYRGFYQLVVEGVSEDSSRSRSRWPSACAGAALGQFITRPQRTPEEKYREQRGVGHRFRLHAGA